MQKDRSSQIEEVYITTGLLEQLPVGSLVPEIGARGIAPQMKVGRFYGLLARDDYGPPQAGFVPE